MHFYNFIKSIKEYKRYYVYGCGHGFDIIYEVLKKYKLLDRLEGIVVSSNSKHDTKYGIKITTIKSLKIPLDVLVINTIFDKKIKEEVELILIQKNVQNYINLYDYLDYERSLYNTLNKQPVDVYIEYLKNWNLFMNQYEDNIRHFDFFKSSSKETIINRNRVTVICVAITVRMRQIVQALINGGFDTEVITVGNIAYVAEDELRRKKILITQMEYYEDVLTKMFSNERHLYIVDAPLSSSVFPMLIINHKEWFGKIIYTSYDMMHGVYEGMDRLRYCSERFCIENADGVIWRYFISEIYKEYFDLVPSGYSIQFVENCEEYDNLCIDFADTGILKLCYITPHAECLFASKDETRMSLVNLDDLVLLINSQENVILHIFVWNVTKDQIEKMRMYEELYPNIHFFYKIEHTKMIQMLSYYDYAINLYHKFAIPEWPNSCFNGYNEYAFTSSYANRLVDYISAGLPIITTKTTSQCEYLNCCGAVILWDYEDVNLSYLIENKSLYKERAILTRKKLLDNKQNELLTEFMRKF